MFKLKSSFSPTGDQPQAIEKLTKGVAFGLKNQVLLGVTGSGKTFTMANVIKNLQMPTLIISHNKTLAGQLYQEFREFFPENAVSYFVSYYDFYQPEAYMPTTDTYIEKEAQINDLIDKLRLQATTNILTRKDVIVVASVSCIYNIGSPKEYGNFILKILVGDNADWNAISRRLVDLQYERSDYEFRRGTFRVRGEYLDVYPAYEDFGYRVYSSFVTPAFSYVIPAKAGILNQKKIQDSRLRGNDRKRGSNETMKQWNNLVVGKITKINPVSGAEIEDNIQGVVIYPAKHFLTDPKIVESAEMQIRKDLAKESENLKKNGKMYEAKRLIQKVNYDLEMIKEVGYVNGIENYSRYFDGRKTGDAPNSLIGYFKETFGDDFLTIIDESHMSVPQIRGMYNGDHARKQTLIDFGFRLQSALDNRPMKFEEFYQATPRLVYVSATPSDWEVDQSRGEVVEQLVRPTGIVDPEIFVRPAKDEIQDLIKEIEIRIKKNEKILVTTLTKKTAEDLSAFLKEKEIKAAYLHSDIKTLERSDVLDSLRKGDFDVLIGVNLLREGLDLPEVTLVAILDADREGFLRSRVSLIQTMGRAARNINSQVILYADVMTDSMKNAISEIERRRKYQLAYNIKNNITAKTIIKPRREKIVEVEDVGEFISDIRAISSSTHVNSGYLDHIKKESLTPFDQKKLIKKLESEMKKQAENLNFELAIKIRDKVRELNKA